MKNCVAFLSLFFALVAIFGAFWFNSRNALTNADKPLSTCPSGFNCPQSPPVSRRKIDMEKIPDPKKNMQMADVDDTDEPVGDLDRLLLERRKAHKSPT